MSDRKQAPSIMEIAAEAIRLELRTFNIQWFVNDVADPVDGSRELTPYNLLAVAVLRELAKQPIGEVSAAMLDNTV